jgi:hypothetical protein
VLVHPKGRQPHVAHKSRLCPLGCSAYRPSLASDTAPTPAGFAEIVSDCLPNTSPWIALGHSPGFCPRLRTPALGSFFLLRFNPPCMQIGAKSLVAKHWVLAVELARGDGVAVALKSSAGAVAGVGVGVGLAPVECRPRAAM